MSCVAHEIRPVRWRRGFTLFEVLLAIALALALAGGMYAFMNNLMLRRDQALAHIGQAQAAGAMIERLETDLFATLVESSSAGAGVEGGTDRIRVFSRGVTPPMVGDLTSVPLGDLQGSEFVFDSGSHELRGARFEAGQEPELEVIAGRIERVRFRYYNGRSWSGSFSSARAGELPVAVEIAVWYQTREREELAGELEASVSEERLDDPELDALIEEQRAMLEEADAREAEDRAVPPPDRLRVIVIPDAPRASLRGGS